MPDVAVSRRLRVLLHDYGGYGFIAQLARELARRGHDVHHVHYASLRSGKGRLEREDGDPPTLRFSGIDPGGAFDRYAVADRLRLERAYARELVRTARSWRPDVVLSSNTPLFVLHWIRPSLAREGIALVNWLQDLHSVAMGEELVKRVGPAGRAGAVAFRGVERRLLRACDGVVCVSEDFLPVLGRWGIAPDRVVVVRNWAELHPPVARANAFSRDHGLDDRVTLLYAGTLGLKHEPLHLVLLAEAFRDRPDVAVVVASEGLGRDWLGQEREARGLSDLLLLDFQPAARVPGMLGTGDVLLSMLRPGAGRFSVPSKVLTYFAAARAQLAAIPSDNLAARQLRESGGGLVVPPDDTEAWVAAARRLVDDAPLRATLAAAGRAYAEAKFDVGAVADTFESVLARAVRA
jgi:glycosyltransferase involved in cell wall biosynthesis